MREDSLCQPSIGFCTLFALALLAFAAHGPARLTKSNRRYEARPWRGAPRAAGGSLPLERGGQLHRQSRNPASKPFVLIEIWKDATARQDFEEM